MSLELRPTPAMDVPRDAIAAFCDRFGVASVALFGSILREDFGPESDVDVLLTFKPGHGFTFENTPEIEDALRAIFGGRPVDVFEIDSVRNPLRRRAVLAGSRVIDAA